MSGMSNCCALKVLRLIFSEHMDCCARNLGVGLVLEIVTSKIPPQGIPLAVLQALEVSWKDGQGLMLH